MIRFVTSGLSRATLISSSILPEVGVIVESSPNMASIENEIVVGDTDVAVAVHVVSSKLIKGVRSKLSIMYCSMCVHVIKLAA